MTDADRAWAERMTEDLAEATRANAALQARVERAEQERDFCAAVLEGRDPNSPAGDGCPKCKCCGRDGHQGAVAREAALRLVRRAEVQRNDLAKGLKGAGDQSELLRRALADLWCADAFGPHPLLKDWTDTRDE